MATDGERYGHKQMTVIEQIQSILEKYPFGNQILKEVIQNADDANAERVEFLLDLDSHSEDVSGLVDPSLAKYQGPALYSWNSATFCEKDWKGIEETGRSCKKEDYLKVGRFGLGFISMYHITDCPWILSGDTIIYLDPQNLTEPGHRYSLVSFFNKNSKYFSHHSCFTEHYFGYNGESEYNGTLFRFPLRTGEYTSSISDEKHSIDEIKSVLFSPVIQEGEHLLPFLKYVNTIRIWEKVNNKISLIHSVGVADKFKQSLNSHRNEITLFADNKQYHIRTCIFIAVYPMHINGNESIWLVMNMLGFGATSQDNAFYKFYCMNTLKYIPWFGIALPTGAANNIGQEHTWVFDWDGNSFDSILQFIHSNVSLCLHTETCLDTNNGKYYCFLPIPKQSLFPFHIHGYFALDDNRRSLKWPSAYDRSPDSEWNMFQTQRLGTVLYASFLYLSIQSLSHQEPAHFHYKLIADYNIHETEDSLFSILQREGLKLILDQKLVYSESLKWIPLRDALFAPSVVPELKEKAWTPDTEKSCIDLLLSLSEPIVELPPSITMLISKYEFLKQAIEAYILSPARMREILKFNTASESFLADRRNATHLLEVVLWDLDPTSEDIGIALELEGLPLILTADSSLTPSTFSTSSETFYISQITAKYKLIFPGLEYLFIDPSLPDEIHDKLLQISRLGNINITDITNIQSETFVKLLSLFLKTTFHSTTTPLSWTPGCNNQPKANWVKALWEFIGTESALISVIEDFPILPQGLLSQQTIQLLPVLSEQPYVEFDATRETTDIERILHKAGCQLCHRHFFIQCFEQFVMRPVPHCLISVLRSEDILTQFSGLMSQSTYSIHIQLIKLFNSVSLDSQEERNIVKRLPIFLNFKEHWNSLNSKIGQRTPILAPKAIPDDIDYPAHILTPFNGLLVVLYQKLNINFCNEKEFIRADLIPFIISNELHNSPETRNLLALWVLDRLPSLQGSGDELVEFLRETKWLVDSSTSHNKVGQVKLFKPSGMLNPIDPLLKQLIVRSNEGFFPNEIYDDHVEKMKKYFDFNSHNNLNSRLRKEVCKAGIINLKLKRNHEEWLIMFNALLQLIFFYFEKLKDQESLWKEFNKLFVLPQKDISTYLPLNLPTTVTDKFFSPSQVICCTAEQISLVAYVKRFIIFPETTSPENHETFKNILTCMGFETDVPCDSVVDQLNYIIECFGHQTCDYHTLHKTMSIIYQFLNSYSTSPSLTKLKSNFIFVQEKGEFIEIAEVVETTDFNMRPYIYSYANLDYKCLQLFKSMEMSPYPTAEQYCSVLGTIYTESKGQSISLQNVEIVINILEALSNLDCEDCSIYILGYDDIMYPISEEKLVFSNEDWLDRKAICSEFPFVFTHERISRQTALKLRIKSFYEQFVSNDHYTTLNQDQPVIHGLKLILESYSDELGLVREMLQNSDDSGASQLKILFDFRTHTSWNTPHNASLLSANMHYWQGPAIWFYNDKVMQESDCDNILCINGEGKANDVTKIGRDGKGFCSAFYLTDLPSFVSGNKLYILDPHMEYTEQNYGQSNACKIDFCKNKFVRFYEDQFKPYQDLFNCRILENQFYDSTLFRIPLRSENIKSQLSVKSYTKAKMQHLQKMVIKYVEDLLLFTENINLIEVHEISDNTFIKASQHIKPVYWIRKESEKTKSFPLMNSVNLENCVEGNPIKLTDYTYECSITSSVIQSPKRWFICYTSGSDDGLADVIRDMCNEDYRIHAPFTSVAFDLDRLTDRNTKCNSNVFCFYPLSEQLQLPYHCNGMFELDRNKMKLISEDSLRISWNTNLISHNLTNAVISLYKCLAEMTCNIGDTDLYSQFLYNIFSKEMCSTPIWGTFCREITRILMDSPLKLFAITSSDGNSFNSFNEVVVLNEEDIKAHITDTYFNKHFLDSINKFLINVKSFKLATIPSGLIEHSGLLEQLLETADEDRIIDMKRLVQIFFESLPDIPEDLMMSILPGLIASHVSTPGLSELISSTPCILCGDTNRLRKISYVIDPNNSILSDMYYAEENRIPSKHSPLFTTGSCYKILKEFFGLNSSKLTLSCLIDRVEKVEKEDDVNLSEKVLTYLNQDIFNNSDSEQIRAQLLSHRFLPTLNNYPLSASQSSLASPDQVVVYPLRHFLGLQRSVLSQRTSELDNTLKLLNIEPLSASDIETSLLLEEIVRCEKDYQNLSNYPELLLDKMRDIYEEISKRFEKDKSSFPEYFHNNCIYIPEVGFIPPNRVIFEHERSFSPYIHSIKHVYRISERKLKEFFLEIGVEQTLTINQCLEILGELKTAGKLNKTEEDLAVNLILELANKLYEEIEKSSSKGEVLLLGEDGCIHNSSESIFFDLKWKEKDGYRGDIKISNKSYYFVHPQISNTNAHNLGAISLSSSIITVANKKLKFDYDVKGQQEKITNRLRDIVNRYEATVEVFKELLQNADDAKAETVKFLFDYTSSYKCESLIQPEMEQFQGPSLYVYNNKTFLDNDFKNILDIGGETKKADSTKIGRFGLGFNTVYHLTDVPSFVSRNYIHMLDPHQFCGEQGLKIDFTENQTILQEFYFDQFSVFNEIFGCNVFSETPYDGTLFRFPFRTSQVKSEIKPSGMFDSEKDIWKLQKSFVDIIEQVIYFLQYIQNIEIYERREQNGKIKLISKVNKTFKTRPYTTSFLTHHEEHFEELADSKEKKEHVSAIEIIEICNETGNTPSSEEYILSYASGTGECIDVINKFQELKQAFVRPVAAVGIPRQLIHQPHQPDSKNKSKNCQEEYKLFCFLPIPKISPYCMHINGYFHLSSYRNELHITDENAHLTQWNCSLVNDALPNALISLLLHIREELLPPSSSGVLTNEKLEKFYSYFPLSKIHEKPWESYPCKTINKIIDSNARLFPCGLHEEKWLTYTEASFLNSNLTAEFTIFLKKFSVPKGVYFFDLPSSHITKSFFKDLFKDSKNNYNLQRLCEELIFPNIEHIKDTSLEDLYLVVSNLLLIYSNGTNYLNHGQSPLRKLAFIPCGDVDPVLRTPPEIVHPNSKFSEIYYPDDKRLPHTDLHKLFKSTYNHTLIKLGVIKDELEDKDLIERCEIAQTIYTKDSNRGYTHSMVLLNYINTRETVPECLTEIAFLPAWVDPLYTHLRSSLASPDQVVVYPLRHFLGLQRCVLSQRTSELDNTLKLLKIEPLSASDIETSLLLEEIVRCEKDYQNLSNYPELLLDKMRDIYEEISKRLGKDKLPFPENFHNNCIYIPEVGFVTPNRVIFELERSFTPYIHSIKHVYRISERKFFLAIGVEQTLTINQCLEILGELKTAGKLNKTEEDLAINLILELANKLYEEIEKSSSKCKVLLLGEDGCIHTSSESIFFDLKWKEKDGYRGDIKISNKSYYFVHPQISNTNAHKLGAISLSSSIITVANKKLKFDYDVKGQQEKITNRLRDIVNRYEATVEVFKELLQNADDAKAETVKFLFDYTSSYKCESLIQPEMEQFQGPSLYVYNNKTFLDNDFKNILDIGGETKKADSTKIGRFGLGFNTVYHLTDVPSFVSRNYIHMLDPHQFCGEQGLKIDFTENQTILQEFYFDQFSVFNEIFGCNVFSETPYDGTLFRFPFRTSQVKSEIKQSGMFDSEKEIWKLQKSFVDIIEQVIYFLQYIQNIEIYERREQNGKIKLISKVNKTFKTRPYTTSFLTHHEEHFEELADSKEKKEHVSAIEIIEICNETGDTPSSEEYILSYASGTGECIDVINKFQELKQAFVRPVAAVGIPRQLIHQPHQPDSKNKSKNCQEEYKLFCFLPIPKISPYCMHINGYFHLSSYRNELHITDENAHLTQWNCSLVNDALPNALISLLLHIREELLPPSSSGVLTNEKLEKFYSYFPLSKIHEKPWESYPCKTINKIIDSNARLFPCGLHEEKWLTYTEASFLNSNLTAEFTIFLKKFSVAKGVYFFDLPSSHITKSFFKDLFKDSKNNYNLQRLCEELIFPNIEHIKDTSLEDLYLVVSNLLLIYSNGTNYLNHGQSPLRKLAFIPCGDVDPVLRTPPEIVHPNSKFSEIYYPDDKRLPHTDLHKLFKSTYHHTLIKLGVIKYELEDKDLIDRCEIAQTIYTKDSNRGYTHSMVLLNYINTRETVPECLTELSFLPAWVDPLYTHLNCRDTEYLVPPKKCYTFSCRYLLTHKYFAVDQEISKLEKAVKLLKIQTKVDEPEILIELLEVLCSKEDVVKEFEEDSFNERMKEVYRWFAEFCFPAYARETQSESSSTKNVPLVYPIGDKQENIKDQLKNKAWIWHPFYKRFYLISQVKDAEYLSYKSDFLISFPYPDLLPKAPKENNVSYFFKFMGLKPEVEHSEAIEILSRMKQKYGEERLKECDVKLALRLITEEIGKDVLKSKAKEIPPTEILLLSETECLHLASDLYRNDITWMEESFSDTDKESIVNKHIPAFISHLLGAKSKRSTYFDDEPCEGIQMEDFGPNEAISDRIENIKTQLQCDVTILNELLQNAEDAGATEIAFILDNQSYPSEHLCFAPDTHRKWKNLQSTPSLLVYNDQAFTERDLIGIQKVGIGGKKSRQTIGRFGIGFNAVYHLTRSPCLLTSPPSGNTTTFCIFDPYREYLNISKKSELPGKKIIIRKDKKCVFKDQLKPYELSPITQNSEYSDLLTNLKSENSYSLFRFPLNANGKDDITGKTERLLDKLLYHSKRLLLFLKHIKRIDILCIDKDGNVCPRGTMISDTRPHPTIPPTVPEFYPEQYLRKVNVTCKNITTKTWSATSTSRRITKESRVPKLKVKKAKDDTEWLCYSHEQSIEHYPDHDKFEDKIETEKLRQVFGNIAIDITNIGKRENTKSYIFCYLPIDTSFEFPVHINAPLIVEQDRRHLKFSEKGQESSEEQWEYTWHKSVIHNVLVPLYAKLILDLSNINVLPTGIEVAPSAYYEWYYSVFPNISIENTNSSFLELISKELYILLHRTEQLVLVSNDLKRFSFTGSNQGVFRKSLDKQFGGLYSVLNKVNYPITDAPQKLLDKLIILKLDYQVIDPFHIVNFLIQNKACLAIEAKFPCQMKDSVLTKEDVFLLLEFVLKASNDQLKELSEIPLKIDSREILCCFSTCTEDEFLSFRPTYASLLPQCSTNFINTEYKAGVMRTLTNSSFIRDLSPEFLAKKFRITESFTESCNQLFWKFALEECKSIDKVIQLFGNHAIVPVCYKGEPPDTKSLNNYPINQLCYLVSEDLKESTPILYKAFKKLDCPFIDLDGFKKGAIVDEKDVLCFLNKKSICKIDQINLEILMGCLSHGHLLEEELENEEAELLRKFLSGMQNVQILTSAKILSNLRIFVTINKTLKSISGLKVCFVNENNFYIGEVLSKGFETQRIGIFSADTAEGNPIQLIKSVAVNLKITVIETEKFVSEYILPRLVELDVEEQKKYLISISKLDEPIQRKIFRQLQTIPFIQKHKSKERVTADQLYSRSVPLFKLCLADKLLPSDWGKDSKDSQILSILTNIGLNNKVNLQILRDCAAIIADCKITDEKIGKFMLILVNFLKGMKRVNQDDANLMYAISNIDFIPIKKIKNIEGKYISYEYKMGNFQSALPYHNLPYCGTMCYILPEAISSIPENITKYLKIKTNPPCKIVIEHLCCLSQHCQQLSPEDNSSHEHLFHKTYSYLQQLDFDAQSLGLKCIMFNGILFDAENLVFEIKEEIYPYLFKVPPSLSACQKFLLKIGVQKVATYKHYTSVLKCIASQCGPTLELKDEKIKKSAKTAFYTLVRILRQLPSGNEIDLNPADTHVLTDNNLIMPCNLVYYADNTSLLAKVKKDSRIQIHILATLQADENGSGVPPVQLQIQNLSQILIPSLSNTITGYQLHNHPLSTQYTDILKSALFHRALMRLYYHETNKNIIHLKSKDGKLYYSQNVEDYPLAEGYVSVLDRIKNLSVMSVKQIDIDLTDQRTDQVVCIQDIMCCFIDTNSSVMYVKPSPYGFRLPTMVAQELNSFFAKIFSKTQTQLMHCFTTNLTAIMSDFDEQEIKNCPFLDEIKLPQSVVAPTPPTSAPPTTSTSSTSSTSTGQWSGGMPSPPKGPVTLTNLTNHRIYAIAHRAACPRPGVNASRPDQSAAKLWIRTAQCDWRAANKLSRKSDDESTVFPPQSCFLCFEATMKALIAFLHLCGGCRYDLYFQRNLCIILEEVKIYTTPAVGNKLSELIIPLMNYDEQTRLPCMTSGMGFNTPRECYTLEMARGAIKSVRQILNKLKEATKEQQPNLESLMLEEGEGGFIETTCLSLNEMFSFPMDCNLGRVKLEIDSEEFFTIARSFFATLPQMKIISIEKIMNKKCWDNFKHNVEIQVSKFGESCLMIKPLFHGTRDTPPYKIFEHPVGFCTDFSGPGMWGKGLYFAVNSSYSHGYAHNLGNGERCMFLAQVFVGYSEAKKNDPSTTCPKPRFHSVQGITNGSQIHILYENGLAYPSYLITYSQ